MASGMSGGSGSSPGTSKVCPICDKQFSAKSIDEHSKDVHGIVQLYHGFEAKKERYNFPTVAEFLKWKESEEDKSKARFVVSTGAKRLADGTKKTTYVCHRSGTFFSQGKGERQLKSQGTSRCGNNCLAEMDAWTRDNGSVTVVFQSQHTGHDENFAQDLLSRDERAESEKDGIIKLTKTFLGL